MVVDGEAVVGGAALDVGAATVVELVAAAVAGVDVGVDVDVDVGIGVDVDVEPLVVVLVPHAATKIAAELAIASPSHRLRATAGRVALRRAVTGLRPVRRRTQP